MAAIDKLFAWKSSLASERSSYTTHEEVIPLEGEEDFALAATVYLAIPKAQSQVRGTILVQTPYGRRAPLSLICSRIWAARGYHVLYVSTRGTFGSSGELDPARYDGVDGPSVVKWMRKQSWYTGSFATLGLSYLGYTQWALMASDDPLDDMVAAIVSVGPHDFSNMLWGTGAHWLSSLDWIHFIGHQEEWSWWRASYVMGTTDPKTLIPAKTTLPLDDGMKAAMGGVDSSLYKLVHKWLSNEDIDKDETGLWGPMKQHKAFDRTKIPVLLIAGWQDGFVRQNFEQFEKLKANGCNVGLTVGPWSHTEVGANEVVIQDSLDWLDSHLGKQPGHDRQSPVRIKVTGLDEWRWLPTWPPPTKALQLYMDTPGTLRKDAPTGIDQSQFTFDPHNPTPTIGGGILWTGGYADDSALAKRTDVLNFDLPVDEDVEVIGTPQVSLVHSSDNPHVDLFVRLSEVNSKGRSGNLCEVYKRLDVNRGSPGQSVTIDLTLSPVAHVFKKGTKLRLLIAGSNFPHYLYNLGSGEPQLTGTTLRPAKHTIHTGGKEGSKFILPISIGQ